MREKTSEWQPMKYKNVLASRQRLLITKGCTSLDSDPRAKSSHGVEFQQLRQCPTCTGASFFIGDELRRML